MKTSLLIALVVASCIGTYFWWYDLYRQMAHDSPVGNTSAPDPGSPRGKDASVMPAASPGAVPRGYEAAAVEPTSPRGPNALVKFKSVPFSKIRSALPMQALDAAVVEVDGGQMVALFEGKAPFTLPLLGDARIRIKPEGIYRSRITDARVLTGQILREADDSPAGEVFFIERAGRITGEIRSISGSFSLMNGPEGQYLVALAPGGDRSYM